MLMALDDEFLRSRMDAKYGGREKKSTSRTHMVQFVRDRELTNSIIATAYTPLVQPMDQRRLVLVNMYAHTPPRFDFGDITDVPEYLIHIARRGMQRVTVNGQVSTDVQSRYVEGLMAEVVRNTRQLQPSRCVLLVMHMCTNRDVAQEWIACFGDD